MRLNPANVLYHHRNRPEGAATPTAMPYSDFIEWAEEIERLEAEVQRLKAKVNRPRPAPVGWGNRG